MAKITYGPIVLDARKKIAGSVFTKVKAGSMVRKKVSPIQPRTPAQTLVRALFTALSKRWTGVLTDTQRAGWIALAALYPVKDKLGATHTRTGLQMYQSVNRHLNTIGVVTPLDDPPTDQNVEGLTSVALDATTPTLLTLTGVTVTAQTAIYAYSSYTGPDPVVGMVVLVAGFVNAGNNGDFAIQSWSGGAAGTFTVALISQVLETIAATATGVGLQVTFAPTTLDPNMHLVVAASKQVSPGVTTSFKGLAFIQAFAAASTSPKSILAAYQAKYGTLVSGRKIQAGIYVISDLNGAASRRMTTVATVA